MVSKSTGLVTRWPQPVSVIISTSRPRACWRMRCCITIHAWHAQVHQDQLWTGLPDGCQRLFAIIGGAGGVNFTAFDTMLAKICTTRA